MNKEKAKILKSIKKGVKEMALIESGKKQGQPADEMIAELIKERDGRGGARAGSGKKSPLQAKYPNEVKKRVTLRLYPTQLKEIEGKYGSLQTAVDALA
jgi:hypothetical protein